MWAEHVDCCKPEFWIFVAMSFVLVAIAAITSGLALGLLSFSQVDLEVIIKAGRPKEKKNAAKIIPLVKNEHLLLCTLLVCKSLAMEALPIFLDSILPSWAAVLMAVILVIACAEIFPQAICARYGLDLGAKLSALVRLLLVMFYPVACPISKMLDMLLGKAHSALYRRAELKTLVDLHANEAGKGGDLSLHETSIITGALDMTAKTAKDAMTPISETFSLDINAKLDMHTMSLIKSEGHSRIPIYSGDPTSIIGLMLVKNLMFCRAEDETPIKNMTIRRIPRVHEDWPLYDILNLFQRGHSHMAVVLRSKEKLQNTTVEKSSSFAKLEVSTDLGSKSNTLERSAFTSPMHSTEFSNSSPSLRQVVQQYKDLNPRFNLRDQGDHGTIAYEDIDVLASNFDGEIIGIVTLEDVMEELLQRNILDETDEYVDLHDKIRINIPPLRRSSSRKLKISCISP